MAAEGLPGDARFPAQRAEAGFRPAHRRPGRPGSAVVEPAPGASGLRHQGGGHWKFDWKTSKGYEGACRAMSVAFDDGNSSPVAHFRFEGKKGKKGK